MTAEVEGKTQPIEQMIPDGKKVLAYPTEYLMSLWQMGMKLAPTFANGKGFNIEGLFTDEDFAAFPECEKKPIRLLYLNSEFWTIERLRKESWRFEGIRCLPGKTFVRDKDGNKIGGPYMLCIGDIDSAVAKKKCQQELENDWLLHTCVTMTRKGNHWYWLEDWREDNDFVSISHNDCKSEEVLFEIMVGLQYAQVAGQHRDDPIFYYKPDGCRNLIEPAIMVRNGLYNKLISETFKDSLLDYNDIKKRRHQQQKAQNPFHNGKEDKTSTTKATNFKVLEDWQINTIVSWASKYYGANGHTYFFTRSFLGTLAWKGIAEESGIEIIDEISLDKGDNSNKSKWYRLLKDAYEKISNGSNVEGRPSLIKAIQRNVLYNEEQATKEVDNLLKILQNGGHTNDNTSTTEETDEEYDERLAKEKVTLEDRNFVLATMQKEAECDGVSTRQLFHGYNSAFTKCPIPHAVNSMKAGAGKTNRLVGVVNYYPSKYVLEYNRCSDKALFHASGTLVTSKFDNESGQEIVTPIQPIINQLLVEKESLENKASIASEDKIKILDIESQIKDIESKAEKLIRLDNTINVFLDTPQESLLDALMSLVSQDTPRDQKYYFAEKSASGQLGTKINRLRGMPYVALSKVVDNTKGERFGERNRRFVHVNPETSAKKIKAANRVTISKYGSMPEEYDQEVVSRVDVERAKRIVKIMVAKLKCHSRHLGPKQSGVLIPSAIRHAIDESIPCKDGQVWTMTVVERLMKYLIIITKEKMDSRPKVVDVETGQSRPIATFEDLRETLDLMNKVASSVRPYQMDWFKNRFIPSYKSRLQPNEEKKVGKDGKEYNVKEKNRGITTSQLLKDIKKAGEPILTEDELRKKYIYPLSDQGLINIEKSVIDGRERLFSPTDEDGSDIISLFDDDTLRLSVSPDAYPSTERVEESIRKVLSVPGVPAVPAVPKNTEYTQYSTAAKYVLKMDDEKVSTGDILNPYFSEPGTCFRVSDENSKKGYKDSKTDVTQSRIEQTQAKNSNPIDEMASVASDIKNIASDTKAGQSDSFSEKYGFEEIMANGGQMEPLCKTVGQSGTTGTLPGQLAQPGTVDIVRDLKEKGYSIREIADILKISKSEIHRNLHSQQVLTQLQPNSQLLPTVQPFTELVPEMDNFAAIDCEWYYSPLGVYCFCGIDNNGNSVKLHRNNYSNDYEFLNEILNFIEKYDIIAGHNITGDESDITQIQRSCRKVGLESRFSNIYKSTRPLDTWKIFSNNITKGFLSQTGVNYSTNSLNDIAQAYIGESKLEGLTGAKVETSSVEIQLQYCMKDCDLVLKMLKKGDYEILRILHSISNLIKQDFLETSLCEYPSNWWESLLTSENYSSDIDVPEGMIGKKYGGGLVLKPHIGIFKDVITKDCSSMYPTIAATQNLSSETINCLCCKDDPLALIPDEVMNIINKDLNTPRPHYWICKKTRGKFAVIQQRLIDMKNDFKKRGMKIEEKAVKIIANAGYGMFGEKHFKYYDPRLAEIITGFGRSYISAFERECANYNLVALYGDTDSIFLQGNSSDIEAFAEMARQKYKVTMSTDKNWDVLVLTRNKKSYFGIVGGQVYHKKVWGLRSNNTPLERELILKLISKEVVKSLDKQVIHDVIRVAFTDLEEKIKDSEFVKSNLFFSFTADKPLNEYEKEGYQREVFYENVTSGKSIAAGERYKYYKIIPIKEDGRVKKFSTDGKYKLDLTKYKESLWNCIEPIAEAYGFNTEILSECLGSKVRIKKAKKLVS